MQSDWYHMISVRSILELTVWSETLGFEKKTSYGNAAG